MPKSKPWMREVAQRTKGRGFGQAERKDQDHVPKRLPPPDLVWPTDFQPRDQRRHVNYPAKPWMRRV